MDGDGGRLYSIGDLARRTGLAVRTIRFYSECGIVAPAGRSPAGYRLYDAGGATRLGPRGDAARPGRGSSHHPEGPEPGAIASRGRRGARRGTGRTDPHPAPAARS